MREIIKEFLANNFEVKVVQEPTEAWPIFEFQYKGVFQIYPGLSNLTFKDNLSKFYYVQHLLDDFVKTKIFQWNEIPQIIEWIKAYANETVTNPSG